MCVGYWVMDRNWGPLGLRLALMDLCLAVQGPRMAHSPAFQPRDRPRTCSDVLFGFSQKREGAVFRAELVLPQSEGRECVFCPRAESFPSKPCRPLSTGLFPQLEGSCGAPTG
jgi:hypothetical protein